MQEKEAREVRPEVRGRTIVPTEPLSVYQYLLNQLPAYHSLLCGSKAASAESSRNRSWSKYAKEGKKVRTFPSLFHTVPEGSSPEQTARLPLFFHRPDSNAQLQRLQCPI